MMLPTSAADSTVHLTADLHIIVPHVAHVVGFITMIIQDPNVSDASIRSSLGLIGCVTMMASLMSGFPHRYKQ